MTKGREGTEGVPMVAGRELDAVVAVSWMGFRWDGNPRGNRTLLHPKGYPAAAKRRGQDMYSIGYGPNGNLPPFSSDLAAAWSIIEEMIARGMYPDLISTAERDGLMWRCEVDWFVDPDDNDDTPPVSETASTPALAICLVALKIAAIHSAKPDTRESQITGARSEGET